RLDNEAARPRLDVGGARISLTLARLTKWLGVGRERLMVSGRRILVTRPASVRSIGDGGVRSRERGSRSVVCSMNSRTRIKLLVAPVLLSLPATGRWPRQ